MIPILSGAFDAQAIASLLLLSLLGLGVVTLLGRKFRTARISRIAFVAVGIDLALLIVLVVGSGYLLGDSVTWHQLAERAALFLTGESNQVVNYVEGKEGYIWIVGALYAIAGSTPVVPIVLNFLCHALTVLAVAKSTEILVIAAGALDPQASSAVRRAAYITAVLPILVWWTPHVLRETLTVLCATVAVCFLLLGMSRRKVWPLTIVAAAVAVLVWIRGSLGVSVGLALVAGGIFVLLGRSRLRLLLRTALIIGILFAMPNLQSALSSTLDVSAASVVSTTAELAQTAASGFGGLGLGLSVEQVLLTTAPRVLLGPFLGELSISAVMLLALIDLVCWLAVVALSARGLAAMRRAGPLSSGRWLVPVVLVVVLVVVVALIVTVGNYGILARFRPIATVLLIPLAGIGSFRIGMWRTGDAHVKAAAPV